RHRADRGQRHDAAGATLDGLADAADLLRRLPGGGRTAVAGRHAADRRAVDRRAVARGPGAACGAGTGSARRRQGAGVEAVMAGTMMEIDRPEVLAEVAAVFARYEQALVSNDVATLDELFFASPVTVRYGVGENLYGIEAIRRYRAERPATGLARDILRTHVTSYGD